MSEQNGNGHIWHRIARDGTFAILLSYLIWFMVNTVTDKLTNIEENGTESIEILKDIRYTLKASNGVTLRNVSQQQP